MKRKITLGLIVLLSLMLVACGQQATNRQNQRASGDEIAFGRTGQTAKSQVWYGIKGTAQPSSRSTLTSVTITQNGKATSFQVPASFTLADAAKLSVEQVKQKSAAMAKQAFTQKRRALLTSIKGALSAEKKILKTDQNATVVSYAAVKMDRRIIANYQRLLTRTAQTRFKKPRPLPFAVAVVKKTGRVKQEMIKVESYAFTGAVNNPNNQSLNYQKTSRKIFPKSYTQTSSKAVKIGHDYFGYYHYAVGNDSGYALTKVAGPNANVKFDTASIKG
ncbi:hypothetical protein ACFQ44_00085 [Levilactobacillus lanxiensis]|uniref:Lipoprotein n=1 Tax=Levilactobacillus lanxiensis TaxID=2799568 RepID=A0ABW4CXP3_9LACO|nr:hypothetical protein [Levilactobacillus lanxiensis]